MQTQKFLLDAVRKLSKGKEIHPSLFFLKERRPAPGVDQLDSLDSLLAVFEIRVTSRMDACVARMMELRGAGLSEVEAYNTAQPHYLQALAHYFGDLHYLRVGMAAVQKSQDPLKTVLTNCIKLWAFKELQEQGYGCEDTKARVLELMALYTEEVSKETARLIDAVAAPLEVIGSPFAAEKGSFERYISLLYGAKGAFERVPWWQEIHEK
jgi:hypothetical protein